VTGDPNSNGLWALSAAESFSAEPLGENLTVDLAIVGGGFTGTSAALTAAMAGAKVCVLEANRIGHGGSGRNVGLVNAGLWLPPDVIAAQMGAEAGERLSAILAAAPDLVFERIARHDIACEPVRSGTLHCAHSSSGLRDLQNRHSQLAARGAPVSLLDADETLRRTGTAAFGGALFDPRAGTIQPLAYNRGLARAARSAGAIIHEATPVQRFAHDGEAWTLSTPGGTVRAKALILATNAYHQPTEGVGRPPHLNVQFFQAATAPGLAGKVLPGGEGLWDTAPVMTSLRTDAAGRIIIGAMGALDHPGAGLHLGWANRKLARLYPELAGTPFESLWFGRIAMTPSHVPEILRLGPRGFAVHGYSGRGIAPGTLFGMHLAEVALGRSEENLPVAAVEPHALTAPKLRSAFFETGATLIHAVSARIG